MSRNLKIFLLAALVCYVVGAMNESTVMYVLSGLSAATILLCFLLSRLTLSRLRCELELVTGRTVAGGRLRAEVHVQSVGSITVAPAGLELRATNATLRGVETGRRLLLPTLRPGAEAVVSVELDCPARGRYLVGPPELFDTDPIGMFGYRRARGEAAEVLALPQTFDLPRLGVWEAGLGRPGSSCERARRDVGEFFGIREHTPGDDLRHVHWKVTAHAGELVVKEYEPIRHDTIAIHLDLRAENHYGHPATSTLETAVSAAASLARGALGEQRFVALEGDGLPGSVSTPGVGEPHLRRILSALAEVRAEATESVTEALGRQLGRARPGGSAFIVTTAVEEGLAEVVISAARRGSTVTVLVVVGSSAPRGAPLMDAPQRVVARLRSAGIGVARLERPRDLARALLATRYTAHWRAVEML